MSTDDEEGFEARELRRYIEDVRMIRRTLDETEGSFRIFAWFYYVMAALVLIGMVTNLLLSNAIHITMHESFVFIWIPAFFLSGAAEMIAWVVKSTREKVPLFTPMFAKYIIAFSGVLLGLFAMAFLFIRSGMPVPGLVLLMTGMMFCVPLQYSHFWFAVEGLGLTVIGLLLILLDAHGTAYFLVDGVLVAASLILAGVIEQILTKHESHG